MLDNLLTLTQLIVVLVIALLIFDPRKLPKLGKIRVEKGQRSTLREGYATLLMLGWPTFHIDWKMCERACASLVPRYKGNESWKAYKETWAFEDFRRRL